MFLSEDQILSFFISLAYSPMKVYMAIVVIMFLSSFGLPVPEEVPLISTGFICFMGMHPQLYPPPYPGALPLNVFQTAVVCFFAVFLSDLVIFTLGRYFGSAFLKRGFMKKYESKTNKVMAWTQRYGQWAAGIFRFTPGLRFPGHLSCGMMGLSYSRFCLVDGSAALLSVPTQVILIAYFGKEILVQIKQFKIALFFVILALIVIYIAKRIFSGLRKASLQK